MQHLEILHERSVDLAVTYLAPPFEHDECVRMGVAVKATLQPLWITHNVVLLSGGRILVQQSKPNWPVIHHCGRRPWLMQLQRPQLIDNDGGLVIHGSNCTAAQVVTPRGAG